MLPAELQARAFERYPEAGRRIASKHVELLRKLPLGFLPLLLRELIVYDWKFPAERRELDAQFAYLGSLSPEQLRQAMAPFAQLRLTAALEKLDWVDSPAIFAEQLTAHLWSTHQIDGFRAGATSYMEKASAASSSESAPMRRLGIAVVGLGVERTDYRPFRKLRPHGAYFSRVQPGAGVDAIVKAVGRRAKAHPTPYAHWHIDAAPSAPAAVQGVTAVSYAALAAPRAALQSRMQKIYEAAVFDPEAFRTRMAQMQAAEIGLETADPVLTRFQLALLTEGSGTQVFATTFAQWAAREALRRAQPATLLVRFGPRQRENPMNVLLAESQRRPELDPQGSLIDADMGAYYTWLNQQRLPGAADAAFLAWFEGHGDAVAIGPGLKPATTSDAEISLGDLLERLIQHELE
jgi:hypothetical protein